MTICILKFHTPEYITSAIRVSMIKLASFGLLGFLVVLILPASVDEQTPTSFLYGAATLVVHDAFGDEIFSQTIHNQLFDQGEDLILNQTFADIGVSVVADDVQIGAICLNGAVASLDETDTTVEFNADHDTADTGSDIAKNCVTDPAVTSGASVVTLGPLMFTADTAELLNWNAGDTVRTIGICDAHVANTDIRGCQNFLFAVVDTSDVTLADTETVDVTYTFDISSAGT